MANLQKCRVGPLPIRVTLGHLKVITSFIQYNRTSLPVLFWRIVFRNRTGIIHFRLMKMFSFQCKTAKNQFYRLMMLIVNKTQLNRRSQNRTRKTGSIDHLRVTIGYFFL